MRRGRTSIRWPWRGWRGLWGPLEWRGCVGLGNLTLIVGSVPIEGCRYRENGSAAIGIKRHGRRTQHLAPLLGRHRCQLFEACHVGRSFAGQASQCRGDGDLALNVNVVNLALNVTLILFQNFDANLCRELGPPR